MVVAVLLEEDEVPVGPPTDDGNDGDGGIGGGGTLPLLELATDCAVETLGGPGGGGGGAPPPGSVCDVLAVW